jgi:hypothetical protein
MSSKKIAFMKKIVVLGCIIISGLALSMTGCKATYPKEQITSSIEKIIAKDYQLKGKARLTGGTLYLEIELAGMISTEPKSLNALMDKVQDAFLTITRVALSSDAKIQYLAVIARDPSWKLNLRLVQRLEDIKGYFYQRISHSDYQDRLIMEIDTNPTVSQNIPMPALSSLPSIAPQEFLGRLIASQLNMLSRNNPFLAILLGNSQLRFDSFTKDSIFIKVEGELSEKSLPLFQELLTEKSKKTIEKLKIWQPQFIQVMGPDNRPIITCSLHN